MINEGQQREGRGRSNERGLIFQRRTLEKVIHECCQNVCRAKVQRLKDKRKKMLDRICFIT